MAAAVALLILSPVCLIQLGGMAEYRMASITEGLAAGIGISVLLVLVAIGVGILISDGMKLSRYQHLEREELSLQYGVKGLVERRRQEEERGYRISVVAGVVLCILGVIPLLLSGALELGDEITISCVSLLLILVAAAVFLFVRFGSIWSSYQKILQEEDYTWERKQVSRKLSWFPGSVLADRHGCLSGLQLYHRALEFYLDCLAGGRGALCGGVCHPASSGQA